MVVRVSDNDPGGRRTRPRRGVTRGTLSAYLNQSQKAVCAIIKGITVTINQRLFIHAGSCSASLWNESDLKDGKKKKNL